MNAPYGSPGNNPQGGAAPLAVELFAHFQHTTRMFFEMQRSQQALAERYLDTQERLLASCLGHGDVGAIHAPSLAALSMPAISVSPAAPTYVAPVMAAPAPAPIAPAAVAPAAAAAPAALRVAPVAAPRAPIAVPPGVGVAPTASAPLAPAPAPAPVVAKPAPVPVAVAVAPAAAPVAVKAEPAPASAGGPPSTDQFRHDLLEIVSERTGYPTDMLDEELPLEAGLGIDSIKTVEIFSKLKNYHQYFAEDGQDEEERLTEFTKLKTLRDIINSYDRRRQAWDAGASGNGQAKLAAPSNNGEGNGAANGNGHGVERYTVAAVEANGGNGSKKNSRQAASS